MSYRKYKSFLNHFVLFNVNGHGVVSRKNDTLADNRVFVGYDAVKISVVAYHCILEQNGVLYYRALSYLYTSEKYAVINGTFDNATVSDE